MLNVVHAEGRGNRHLWGTAAVVVYSEADEQFRSEQNHVPFRYAAPIIEGDIAELPDTATVPPHSGVIGRDRVSFHYAPKILIHKHNGG